MRILWFTNKLLPAIAEKNNLEKTVNEGWLTGMSDAIIDMNSEIELIVAGSQSNSETLITGNCDGISRYYGYYEKNSYEYDQALKNTMTDIIGECHPDVIHIMGTEFPHTYSVLEACQEAGMLNKAVLSIQGLVSVYAYHCYAALEKLPLRGTLKEIRHGIGKTAPADMLKRRGEYEIKALKMCKNVIGRTHWDRECVRAINPDVEYYFNNEVLRREFYGRKWTLEDCERHSVLFSEVYSPVKGFHNFLKAWVAVVKRYPDARAYVAGSSKLVEQRNWPSWRRLSYEDYLLKEIEKNGLEKNYNGPMKLDH